MSGVDRWDPSAEHVLHYEVVALLARHARAVDRKDWPTVIAAYHEDAIDDHGAFVGKARDFVAWLSGRMESVEMIMHFHGATILLDIDHEKRSVLAETQCIGWMRLSDDIKSDDVKDVPANYLLEDGHTPGTAAMGVRYVDVLTDRGDGLRIQHRTVVHEWATVGPDRALAAFGGRLTGLRGPQDFSYLATAGHRGLADQNRLN